VLSLPADYPVDQRPTILGGGLDDVYIFQQLHFHWGDDDTHGSEHTLNSIPCGCPEIFI
jgi:Eukaryotic-type carbonic anhydrase